MNLWNRETVARDLKEIVTESFAVTDMTAVTAVTCAVLFCYESKVSGFYANERP